MTPLYDKFKMWEAGELTHEDMDRAIHEIHKQNQTLYHLFVVENQRSLVRLIQVDRAWFKTWVIDNPPPSGIELVPYPD